MFSVIEANATCLPTPWFYGMGCRVRTMCGFPQPKCSQRWLVCKWCWNAWVMAFSLLSNSVTAVYICHFELDNFVLLFFSIKQGSLWLLYCIYRIFKHYCKYWQAEFIIDNIIVDGHPSPSLHSHTAHALEWTCYKVSEYITYR